LGYKNQKMKKIIIYIALLFVSFNFAQNLESVKFTNIGPTIMSGRVVDIAVNENNPLEFYVAYASGGVWYTNNNGNSFTPITNTAPTQNIGCITVDWQSGLLVVGTGEVNSSRSSYAGVGVIASTDKGKTWQNIGLADSHHISSIWVNPKNNQEIVVGVLGHLYTPNEERGVFKTTDGGKNWKKTLFVNQDTGIVDLAIAPNSPNIMLAAAWERERKAWNFKGNGENSGIYKSVDAGNTWTKLNNYPTNKGTGRIGITSYNDQIFYAVVDDQNLRPTAKDAKMPEDANAALFETEVVGATIHKTTDGGKNWIKMNEKYIDDCFFSYGYYFADITVNPADENKLYLSAVPLLFSDNGGKRFKVISKSNVHADHHVNWVNPKNPNHIINGNDGGVNITFDNGAHWFKCNNQAVGQFYAINVDTKEKYEVYGGLQDNGVWAGPNDYEHSYEWQQDGKYPYEFLSGGDGMQVQIDSKNPEIIYTGYQFGNYFRINRKTGERTYITPKQNKKEEANRYNWQTPILLSSHNNDIVYFAAQHLYRSFNQGKDWNKISGDLTNGKKEGNVPFGTITSVSESKLVFGNIVVGTDDGNVQLTTDNGNNWTKISDNLPQNLWVSRVKFSQHKKERIYVTLNGYRNDDFTPYVYVSEDFGKTWKNISNGLTQAVNVILEDNKAENILYVGTDNGLFISTNFGQNWQLLNNDLPNVAIHDLVIQPKAQDLIVGTHGRSLYKTSVKNIQELNIKTLDKNTHLFAIENIDFNTYWGNYETTDGNWLLPKVTFSHYHKNNNNYTITLKNKDGIKVYSFKGSSTNGIANNIYDLTLDEKTKNEILTKDKKLKINKTKSGHYFLPAGIYTAELFVNNSTEKQTFEIKEKK
jgi:photosystem II stability/assembly factor-like uncharacterized protein